MFVSTPGTGTPLAAVTFVVVDLETTGLGPDEAAIAEVGAVKVRMGEVLGTLQTFVNPEGAIPDPIVEVTGITHRMVCNAPRIDDVIEPVVGFLRGGVIVGHNVRFDLGFLDVAMRRAGFDVLANPVVDTLDLARWLLVDEVPNHRLDTLAEHLRTPHRPSHRALADAWATVDVLHALLERAGSAGLHTLEALGRDSPARDAVTLRPIGRRAVRRRSRPTGPRARARASPDPP